MYGSSEISIRRWILELNDNGMGLLDTRLTRLKVLDGYDSLHASKYVSIPLGDSDKFHTEEKLKELLRSLIVQSVEKKSSKEVLEKLKDVQNQLKLSKMFDLKTDNLIDYSFCFTILDDFNVGGLIYDVEWLSVDVFVQVGNEKMFDFKRLAVVNATQVVNPQTETCDALFKAVSQYCGFSTTQKQEANLETHSAKEWEELSYSNLVNINNMNDDDMDIVPLELVMEMAFENPLFHRIQPRDISYYFETSKVLFDSLPDAGSVNFENVRVFYAVYKQKEVRIGNKYYPVYCYPQRN